MPGTTCRRIATIRWVRAAEPVTAVLGGPVAEGTSAMGAPEIAYCSAASSEAGHVEPTSLPTLGAKSTARSLAGANAPEWPGSRRI